MPEAMLIETTPFARNKPIAVPGLVVAYRDGVTVASIAAYREKAVALSDLIEATYGVALPAPGRRVSSNAITLQWSGPGQWLAIAERGQRGGAVRDLEAELKPIVAGLAAVVDQSDARGIVAISGTRALNVLAKGVPIDLHERAFATGDVANTHASHIAITIARLDDTPTFELTMYRSYATSFTDWLRSATAEFVHTQPR
ncbi:MAG: sarcosine oxidase subunit gamma [Hyphomicrobiaceae bacterium]|nr:sarcosine oxidase subunit gamma [Hyphomicrobiaceae bacterium]